MIGRRQQKYPEISIGYNHSNVAVDRVQEIQIILMKCWTVSAWRCWPFKGSRQIGSPSVMRGLDPRIHLSFENDGWPGLARIRWRDSAMTDENVD
jgi:hypothetical protein